MKFKNFLRRLSWVLLAVLMTVLMIWRLQIASENVRIYKEPDFDYYVSLFWEILKEVAVLLPIWLLSFLGLLRSFFGENWLPFAEKIPIRLTKLILAIAAPLLVCITIAGAMYSDYSNDSYVIQNMMENRFEAWKTTLAWILYYGIMLYIEQWGIQRNCVRKDIRKQQVWVTVTIALMWLILFELSCVNLWYIPLGSVDSPNDQEDYYLWWFSLYSAVFLLPILFLSGRRAIRSIKNNAQWLTLSTIVPKKVTALIVLAETALVVWQIRECRSASAWVAFSEVPEYTESRAMKHLFLAIIGGLAFLYTICLLIKQALAVHRVKREQNAENLI